MESPLFDRMNLETPRIARIETWTSIFVYENIGRENFHPLLTMLLCNFCLSFIFSSLSPPPIVLYLFQTHTHAVFPGRTHNCSRWSEHFGRGSVIKCHFDHSNKIESKWKTWNYIWTHFVCFVCSVCVLCVCLCVSVFLYTVWIALPPLGSMCIISQATCRHHLPSWPHTNKHKQQQRVSSHFYCSCC